MDARRTGALVAGASGVLLIASLFLPWFGLDLRLELPGDEGTINSEQARLSGWEAFGVIDLLLFAGGALGIALAVRGLVARLPHNQLLSSAVAAAGALCALLIVFRLLVPPEFVLTDDDAADTAVGRRIGAFFGLLGAAGMAWGSLRAGGAPEAAASPRSGSLLEAFEGDLRLAELRDGVSSIPMGPGLLAVARRRADPPEFLDRSPGAAVGERDPSVSRAALQANWVEGAELLYLARTSALRGRVRDLVRFGSGTPTDNWGGRLIWQLADADELLVSWSLATGDGLEREEAALLGRFRGGFGRPPFANDPQRMGR